MTALSWLLSCTD